MMNEILCEYIERNVASTDETIVKMVNRSRLVIEKLKLKPSLSPKERKR